MSLSPARPSWLQGWLQNNSKSPKIDKSRRPVQGSVSSSKSRSLSILRNPSKSGQKGLIIPRSSVRVAPPPPSVSRTCGPLQVVPPRRVNAELITKFFAAVWGTSAPPQLLRPAHGCRTRVYKTPRRRPCQFALRRPHAVAAQLAVPLCGHDALVAEQFLNPSHGQAGDREPAREQRMQRDPVAPLRAFGVQPGFDKKALPPNQQRRIRSVRPHAGTRNQRLPPSRPAP